MKIAKFNRRHIGVTTFATQLLQAVRKMGKFGTQCCAFGCSKRRKKVKVDDTTFRSDSKGTDDEESELKRTFSDIS